MNREAIVKAASKMTSTYDFLVLLNRIKMDELGDKGHPFTIQQLNYFINPKRNSAHYRTFTIPKKSGGARTISAPEHMLKSLQTYTNRILQAIYEAPDYVTGFVPGRSVVDNAERHLGMNYVFNADLKDFFPSIPQARVWGALKARPFNFNGTVASAIAGLCCIQEICMTEDGKLEEKYYLPQGSPCSPVLTNIVCHNLDWKLNGLARRFHLRYSRYADDITFSGNSNVFLEDREFMAEFRRIVAEQNFTINEKKTRLQKRGERQEVTGLVVSDRVNVAREYVRDLDNLLYIWERHGHNSAFAKFLSHYTPKENRHRGEPDMKAVIQGKLMYLRMVKGEDSPVWRRLQKRFNRLTERQELVGGTDIVYLHSYTIEAFEKATGCIVEPFIRGEDGFPGVFIPNFTLNGRLYSVQLSKYARTRLKNVLESDDPAQLAKFKRQFQIAYCQVELKPLILLDTPPDGLIDSEDVRALKEQFNLEQVRKSVQKPAYHCFWMIYRGLRKKRQSDRDDINPDEWIDIFDMEDGAEIARDSDEGPDTGIQNAGSLSTDEVLDALLDSDFDLNTLDKWEKTKRDS